MKLRILQPLYTQLQEFTNKSINETELYKDDLRYRMETLVLSNDTVETLLRWIEFFTRETVLNNLELVALVEQIFYELLWVRGFAKLDYKESAWKFDKVNMKWYLDRILDRYVRFFEHYVDYLRDLALKVSGGMENYKVQLMEHVKYIVQNFGILRRKQRSRKQKPNDVKEWHLLEELELRNQSLIDLLQNFVPWESLNQIDKNEKDEIILLMQSALSERERLQNALLG